MILFTKKKIILIVSSLAVVSAGFLVLRSENVIEVFNDKSLMPKLENKKLGVITGTSCDNSADLRPLAIMLSSDPETRPLSGIGQADIVFEMPVTPNGVTRMMAIYQCERPKEIGSVRSARLDFVPLALGLNAIYAHFGGEHDVLEKLNFGVIDNIDGLKYDGTIYYRKRSIPRPHNAFTSANLIQQITKELNYKTTTPINGYPHDSINKSLGETSPPLSYEKQFAVSWDYNKNSNSYSRSRAGKPEIDKNTGKQVRVQNVVEMQTTWSPINLDYLRIKTVGSGIATFYSNGQAVRGTWEKKDDKDKLFFYGPNHKEFRFTPGKVWVEIVI